MSLRVAQDLIPEGVLLVGAALALLLGVLRPGLPLRVHMTLAIAVLAVAALSSLVYLRGMPVGGYAAYSDGLVVDRLGVMLSVVACAAAALAALAGDSLRGRIADHAAEYHALLLGATLGAVLAVSAREMMELWAALQLLGVCSCVLVAIVKIDARGAVAALRLLVVQGVGAAVLLLGLAAPSRSR